MKTKDIDFLIIGAAKCATTWLQYQLQADPSVYMPDPELHFFSREFDKGQNWYLNQFEVPENVNIIGEKSNSYLSDPNAAQRIHKILPDIKLVVQLRNPIERAYSDYCMLFRRGSVGPDIEYYLDPNKSAGERCIHDGIYAPQIQTFLDFYERSSLLILDFDGIAQNPEGQMNALREHLGLDAGLAIQTSCKKVKDKTVNRIPPNIRKKLGWLKPIVKPFRETKTFKAAWSTLSKASEYPELTPKLRGALSEFYQPYIRQLELMTDHSKAHWK